MKKIYAILAALLATIVPAVAQIVTTEPPILQAASQGVVLTYHADAPEGNNGLKNLSTGFDVYAHIGVITNKSTGDSDWKYVVTPWPNTGNQSQANLDKNRLSRTATNTYTLNIGNIRTYFGITDAAEKVQKIAIVFRNADGSKQGKTSTGGDIFVDVRPDGFATEFTSNHPDRVIDGPTTVTYTFLASAAADLSISVGTETFATAANATKVTGSYTFKDKGTYTVTAKAVYAGKTYTEELTIIYPDDSLTKPYPGGGMPRMGAVKNADGTVTFCLAAPRKQSVVLVGSWEDYAVSTKNTMYRTEYGGNTYFWITVAGLANDQWYSYYYIVDDKYKVGDPYAHLVLDPYNDKYLRRSVWKDAPKHPGSPYDNIVMGVYRGDIDDYTFSPFTIPDHDNLLVYELLLRDFTGINGQNNGWGTVRDAISKIPYIKSMGFNCVELMPIMEFSGNNSWGYNTNFYMAPDKSYGSPTDYKDFVEECHRNGIAVVLDIVFNQSDGLHPWYQMYEIDSNPFYNKTAPHSWSVLNDWNQGYALVQQQWTDALKYWMEKYNVDGYRFDLVKGLGNNESYAAAGGTEQYNSSRVANMKRLHGVIKSVKPNGIHINELLAGAKEEIELGNDGQIQWANVNNASCQFAMGWDNGDNNISRFLSSSDGGRPWGSTVSYAESHDEQRMAFKSVSFGAGDVPTDLDVEYNRLAALAVQMLLTPGPKMVWMFGELGDDQNAKSKADGSGDNNTSPKYVDWRWLDDPHKAFLKDTYAAIGNLRMDNPDLFSQNATYKGNYLSGKFTRMRSQVLTMGNKEVIAFINPTISGDAQTVTVTATSLRQNNCRLVCASKGFEPKLTGSGAEVSVTVPANGFAVFCTESTVGVENVATASGVSVYGTYGAIVVEGPCTTVAAYDLQGRATALTGLRPGLYIAVVDGTAHKVLVK